MIKIHRNILIILFSIFTIPISFFVFSEIWEYFKLSIFKSENIFIRQSSCDPNEAEPTYLVIFIVLFIGIFLSYFISKKVLKV